MVAHVADDLRIRFSTSHPKDMTDDVLHIMQKYKNICNTLYFNTHIVSDIFQIISKKSKKNKFKSKSLGSL